MVLTVPKSVVVPPLNRQFIYLIASVFVAGAPKPVQAHALAVKNMAKDRTKFDAENAIQVTYELDNGIFGTHTNHSGTEEEALLLTYVPGTHG